MKWQTELPGECLMKVEIFRRTVKDRRRGNSYELLYHLKEGIEASGDEAIIVNENRTGPTVEGEMTPTEIGRASCRERV